MSKRRSLSDARSPRHLLRVLTDNPALPQFVRSLDVPVLKRLIEHVGLRDAGELVRLTTVEQMRDLFEVALWETLVPGQAEQLRPEKFLDWLDVMLDASPSFTAQRLVELGDTFVVLNLAPLISVVDRSVLVEHQQDACACVLCRLEARDQPFDMIEDYLVIGVHDDEWDAVKAVLLALEDEDAGFLHRVLARCSSAPTMHAFAPDGQALLEDETWARTRRRERGGFVTPELAARFLDVARRASLDDLVRQEGYDEISRRHFEHFAAAAADQGVTAEPVASEAPEDAAGGRSPAHPTLSAFETGAHLRDLERALADAELLADRQPRRLTGPAQSHEPILELRARLDRLQQTQPEVFAARLTELVFLANVLMAGSWYQGERFTETRAATAALACANLGLDLLVQQRGARTGAGRNDAIDELLGTSPGLVRLFRVGWNLIQAVPVRSAKALLAVLRAEHVRDQLARKRWMLDEIEWALGNPDILALIAEGEFADVGDNLVLLGLVLDERACLCLRTLISDFPRYPLQLGVGFRAGPTAGARPVQTNASRFLATLEQLAGVDAFLGEIDTLLKI